MNRPTPLVGEVGSQRLELEGGLAKAFFRVLEPPVRLARRAPAEQRAGQVGAVVRMIKLGNQFLPAGGRLPVGKVRLRKPLLPREQARQPVPIPGESPAVFRRAGKLLDQSLSNPQAVPDDFFRLLW